MTHKELNRLKLLLVEKKKTGLWLAEQLGKDKTTISKWCTNSSQPDVSFVLRHRTVHLPKSEKIQLG